MFQPIPDFEENQKSSANSMNNPIMAQAYDSKYYQV